MELVDVRARASPTTGGRGPSCRRSCGSAPCSAACIRSAGVDIRIHPAAERAGSPPRSRRSPGRASPGASTARRAARAARRTARAASPRAAPASASASHRPRRRRSGGIAFIADLADRVLAELAGGDAAADVVDVGQVAVVGRLDRDDRAQVRRPQLGDLDRGEPAVADAPHPDRPVAPRLRGEPLDRVVAVEGLRLGVLVEGDRRRTIPCHGRRPGTGRSRAGRGTSPRAMSAFRRQLSLPYGIISRIAGKRSGVPAAGRGSHRLADSSTPSRAGMRASQTVSTSWRGSLAGRPWVWSVAAIAASLRAARRAGRARPRRATMARWTRRPRRQRPVDPSLAPGRLRERLDHGLARRGDPARRQPRDLRRRPLREPGGRGPRPRRRATACCSSASIATRSTPTRGRSPRAACPTARARSTGARRELREETGVEAETWRELARVHLSNSVSDELAVLFLATGLTRARRRPIRPRRSRSAGCRSRTCSR